MGGSLQSGFREASVAGAGIEVYLCSARLGKPPGRSGSEGEDMDGGLPAGRVGFTASAAARVAELARLQGDPGLALRLSVSAGGCSGFQYGFDLTAAIEPDDIVLERDGARLVVDPVSLDLLAGSELDYVEELMGAHFAVRNPNATASCGCGTSFSV